jgi:5'-nucleotidase (lipoprotein e(P4) family)
MRLWPGFLLAPLVVGCASHRAGVENLNSVLWVQTSGEYEAIARQSYVLAGQMLERALADPGWTAALEQGASYRDLPPAVILDVDETVLNNSAYQAGLVLDGKVYDSDSWNEWCQQVRATAIPGAVGFTRRARDKGVAVFYVTNRRKVVEEATRENLTKLGFPLESPGDSDRVWTRGEHGNEDGDKSERRRNIASQYRVLLLIGDNLDDFLSLGRAPAEERRRAIDDYASYWGTRWIVLPNPQYGSWEGAVLGFNYGLSEKDKLDVKKKALSP